MEQYEGGCFTKLQSSDESDAGGTSRIAPEPVMARMPTDRDATHYNMNHTHRGKAIIFNHENFGFEVHGQKVRSREGTNVDAKSMAKCLFGLGFDVMMYQDSDYDTLMQYVNGAAEVDHSDYDCFVMVVLSHGDDRDILYAYDKVYDLEDLWTPFSADICTTLAGKPKLFFIQACRGGNVMAPVLLHNITQTDGPSSYTIPSQADFLFVFSNIPGYCSWRCTTRGSWFIEVLCQELKLNAYEYELGQLLTFVNRRVAIEYESNVPNKPEKHQRKQIISVDSRLMRLVQFNIKINKFDNAVGQQQRTVKKLDKNNWVNMIFRGN